MGNTSLASFPKNLTLCSLVANQHPFLSNLNQLENAAEMLFPILVVSCIDLVDWYTDVLW